MKKYVYYISFLLFACIQVLDAKVVIDEKVLEPALISVVYERTKVTDTLNAANDYRQDLLTLKAVGNAQHILVRFRGPQI